MFHDGGFRRVDPGYVKEALTPLLIEHGLDGGNLRHIRAEEIKAGSQCVVQRILAENKQGPELRCPLTIRPCPAARAAVFRSERLLGSSPSPGWPANRWNLPSASQRRQSQSTGCGVTSARERMTKREAPVLGRSVAVFGGSEFVIHAGASANSARSSWTVPPAATQSAASPFSRRLIPRNASDLMGRLTKIPQSLGDAFHVLPAWVIMVRPQVNRSSDERLEGLVARSARRARYRSNGRNAKGNKRFGRLFSLSDDDLARVPQCM